jgi:hypothetical protein
MTESLRDRLIASRDRFVASLSDGRAVQARLLDEIVGRNRDTAFGREHGFAEINSHAHYVGRVPVRDHEGHAPWLGRCLAGERNVLTAAPVKMFLGTTGSTGEPKLFPATQAYLSDSARDTATFWGSLIAHEPALLERDDAVLALHLIPRPFTERTELGVPVHRLAFMSSQVKGALPFTRASWYPPPAEVPLRDLTYYLLRASCQHPVVGVVCQHSSRLTGLLFALRSEAPRLIDEIRAGTLFGAPFGAADPARADELAALLARDALTPRHLWPSLRIVTAWHGATYDLVRAQIAEGFGAPVFPAPCVSTEAGHINMPVDVDRDGPLAIHTSYYEFRAQGETATMTMAELEEGPLYEMIITTKSGLYRYCCSDLFRVVGRVGDVPRVEFVARAGTANLTGEKLSDVQAQLALVDAVGDTAVVGATICATWGEPPFYTALFEPTAPWSESHCDELAARMDAYLHAHNSRYAWKRDWNELAPLRVRTVSPGTFARVQQRRVLEGAPLPTLKQRPLHADLSVLSLFVELDRRHSGEGLST